MASDLVPSVEPIKVLAMVLQQEMGLLPGQIMLGLENWEIPKTLGLYVALLYGPDQVVGNNNYNSVDSQGNYIEVQDAAMLHQIDVEVMSFNSEARLRKEGVLWAIKSYTAETLMEQYQMRLASTPGAFVPVPSPEPTKQLNRFQLTVTVNALHRNVKITTYYDALQPVQLVENP